MESFWRHSIACGIIAKILAVYRRDANVERFFVAGILHDIGRLIIFTSMPDTAQELLERCGNDKELLFRKEREVMGFDHADVGEALLKEWKLPTSLREMVSTHHNPLRAKHFPVESAAVHVADIIAHSMQLGNSGDHLVPPLEPKAWEVLDFSPAILTSVLDQTERQFGAAMELIQQDARA